ncbi:MAG: CotH kinase family protein [Bacteroidales bacterium]|nr:CotH kinase family protein [Bacteroidales bacterium]
MNIRFYIGTLIFIVISYNTYSQNFDIIPSESEWKYHKGTTNPSNTNVNWHHIIYDDSDWSTGFTPIWYGDGINGTELTDMQNNYSTVYLRKIFKADSIHRYDQLLFSINYDDGFNLWINDALLINQNAPLSEEYNSLAIENHESGTFETFTIDIEESGLKEGDNIISVIGYNISLESSDFHFNLSMSASIPVEYHYASPPEINTSGGFYTDPFYVEIITDYPGDSIKYTLDCSNPQFSETAISAISPVSVYIDPASAENRPLTPAVMLRASRLEPGLDPSLPVTATYIFIENVKIQAYPGGDWPASDVNNQILDYEMDPDVVNDSRYTTDIENALLDIPSISLVTDNENLFDPATGIYVNANMHGIEWERFASVELINPDGREGFSVNAGLRIRGGWSRHPECPKHAFRLFFREKYGTAKLHYPLFENEGVTEFDKIDLRTSQNYSWSYYADINNTMNRDVFSRDIQGKMKQPYTRSRYYHLYLNGMYWGLFQSQERPEARFAESYLGGDKEDYDVVKINLDDNWGGYNIEATDGNLDAWREVWNLCQQGFESNSNYYKIQGLNENGEIDTSLKVLVDIDNLIDYMLIIFYAGNFDAPTSKFGNNKMPNNFYAIYNRTRSRDGFKFFAHDAEHTLLAYAASPGIGINENRVNIGDITDQYQMIVTSFSGFHPQWLHHKLKENAEYRARFASRAYKHLYNNGILTKTNCRNVFLSTANQIDMAIIGESARWGDAKTWGGPPLTKENWQTAVNTVTNNFIEKRTPIVVKQLKDNGLLPETEAPVFKNGSTEIQQQEINYPGDFILTIENPNSSGIIYYSTKGYDPRIAGGEINPKAQNGGEGAIVNINSTTHLKARIKNGDEWSALHELFILGNDDLNEMKITEISYNPLNTDYSREIEFIELKNIGDATIDISEVKIDSGIRYTFPTRTMLYPKGFVVLASNKNEFEKFYRLKPTGEYKGHLSNNGDTIIIYDQSNNILISCEYSPDYPWPVLANGFGYTLVPRVFNPDGDPSNKDYWRESLHLFGSPFTDDTDEIIEIISTSNQLIHEINVFPNPVHSNLYIYNLTQIPIIGVSLINLNGQEIYELSGDLLIRNNGRIIINFDNLNINTGIYLLKILSAEKIITRKIVYQK